MKKTETLTISINGDDKRLLSQLQKKLAGIGNTAIFRLAIRALDRQVKA